MRIAILADQHGALPPIPACDLVILSGDLTGGNPHGPRDDSDDKWTAWLRNEFATWICAAPTTLPVVITGGNHDTSLERIGPDAGGIINGVACLIDASINRGNYRIWGTPWIRRWDALAFNLTEDKLKAKWAMIPYDTDILVCHQPPKGYGDDGKGCPHLTERIRQIKPKLVTCGHIHEGRGIYDLDGTQIVNASGGFITVDL